MREIATRKKPVFVQANFNSGQGHVLHYITSFCVVIRLSTLYFWLAGKTETKQVVNRMSKWVEGGGSWKGHESGQAVFIFLAATPLLRPARQNRHATQAKEIPYVSTSWEFSDFAIVNILGSIINPFDKVAKGRYLSRITLIFFKLSRITENWSEEIRGQGTRKKGKKLLS